MPGELCNEAGELVWSAQFTTWGTAKRETWQVKEKSYLAQENSVSQNLRYQGQYFDTEIGLHYKTFRFYDPDVGRFISSNPIGLGGGLSLYSYAPNSNIWIDPWGWATVDATFEMAGHAFFGTNPTERAPRISGPTIPGMAGPNVDRYGMHAEIEAMLKAHDEGLRGGTARLTVDGKEVCAYCKRSLKNFAKALELDELEIHEKATGKFISSPGRF